MTPIEWKHIIFRDTTDEDGIDKERYPLFIENAPADGDVILVVIKHRNRDGSQEYLVRQDEVSEDDGLYYLESGLKWEDAVAWAEMPEYSEPNEEKNK